ncbi:uncharacterized protein LOC144650219 [Oculina patagonica]
MKTLVPRPIRVIGRYSNGRLFFEHCQRFACFIRISLTMAEEVDIEQRETENQMMEKVKEFLKVGCECSRGPKDGPCSSQFTEEEIITNLNNCHELSSRELDLVVLANIQAVTRVENVGQKRKRSPRSNFLFQSMPICRDMFLILYGISDSRLRRLREHYENSGLTSRTHGNTKQLPKNTLPYAVVEDVKLFLSNYAEENAISLPGRIPGYKDEDIKLLSSHETKIGVWRTFEVACKATEKQAVSYSKFVELWEQFHPNLVVAKPMTDLCLTCQQNTTKLLRAANLPDREKSDCVREQQEHLNLALSEREHYKAACKEASDIFQAIENTIELSETRAPCSTPGTMHYSFDYAQQVHYPSNPMQPGPIYFKTPRKCGIFGIICEAIPRQVNYLIDEASSVGKGANSTISYVHNFFANHGLGETHAHLHADNCSGQNKNNYFLWYFAWRIMSALHQNITYSFLIAGHTKFAPDRCFGIIKKAYKVNFISSIYELAEMIEGSSSVGVNKVQLVGTHDGRVIVPVYDWASFLGGYFKKIPNILKYHHFRFSVDEPGKVYCKEKRSSAEQSFMLLKDPSVRPPPAVLPPEISPEGLNDERKSYLYREIRQFCKFGTEDFVAPAP